MVTIREARKEDVDEILSWNENTEDFLTQWSNFTYPLTKEQYLERIDSDAIIVFAIEQDGCLAGTIQIFRMNKGAKSAIIGCFLINPSLRGAGIGEEALKLTAQYAFEKLGLSKVILNVFDFNKGAIRCYEKAGFYKVSEYVHNNGWKGYQMVCDRKGGESDKH